MKIIINNGLEITPTFSTFPAGEEYVRIDTNNFPLVIDRVDVITRITSSADVMRLMLITEALRAEVYGINTMFSLTLGYLPYARQDRRFGTGESHSLKVITKMINSLEYHEVRVADCHSDVGLALLDNVVHINQLQGMVISAKIAGILSNADAIIAPDAGAAKKAAAIADYYNKPLLQGIKVRDEHGVPGVTLFGNLTNVTSAAVVDDICDGGATFLSLATQIPDSIMELSLVVTHGIFSKGKSALMREYKEVEAVYDWTK